MPPKLQRLDIFFTRGEHWLSRAIRSMTRSTGEAPTVANHVGIIGEEGYGLYARGIEALGSGVKYHQLSDRYTLNSEICVFRPVNLSPGEFDLIFAEARKLINRPYGWGKIILHALDWCIGGQYVFRRIGGLDSFPICSYLVADAYRAGGKDFGVSTRAASPDDIWDFVTSHPDKYRFVWQQGRMFKA
jgi:hypothetical protein